MKLKKHLNYLFMLFFLTVFLAGCGGLPDELLKKVEKIPENIKQTRDFIVKKHQENKDHLATEQGKFFAVYAKDENWQQFFHKANELLQKAEQLNNKTIIPLVDNDDPRHVVDIGSAIHLLNKHLADARSTAMKVAQRKEFLLATKKNAPELVKKAQTTQDKINQLLDTAKQYTNKPIIDYPARKQDINSRYEALNKHRNDSLKSLSAAEIELAKVASNKANYAVLGDGVKNIDDTHKKLVKAVPDLKSKYDELYRSYSKTLTDMRVDYYVEIGRTSWDNYYDYPAEHTRKFKTKVDKAVAEYFDNLRPGKFATSRGRSFYLLIDKRMWNALKVDPFINWPRGDDEAEFWLNTVEYKYYHKYMITENNSESETDWQPVNENYFWQHEKDLGLTLYSKPYGMYEEEAIKIAAPPGMEYIAKPLMINGKPTGKNQYGEWRQDSSGLSFWHYYMAYSLLRNNSGGYYRPYYYSDWNHYNSRNRSTGYYGSGSRYGTYGSDTYKNSRYSRSSYSRQNPGLRTASGRKRLQTASIRNSGPKGRGRGPSGGGK